MTTQTAIVTVNPYDWNDARIGIGTPNEQTGWLDEAHTLWFTSTAQDYDGPNEYGYMVAGDFSWRQWVADIDAALAEVGYERVDGFDERTGSGETICQVRLVGEGK